MRGVLMYLNISADLGRDRYLLKIIGIKDGMLLVQCKNGNTEPFDWMWFNAGIVGMPICEAKAIHKAFEEDDKETLSYFGVKYSK